MTFWVAMYGQSNMEFMSATAASPPAAVAGTSYYDGVSLGSVPAANGVRELLNGIKNTTGLDCAALNGAVSGVPISSLQKGQTAYTNLMAQITAMGGVMNCIIFHQGEGDSNTETSSATWIGLLGQLHTDLTTDMGVTKAQCPLFIASLATHTESSYPRWSRQQKSILDAADQLSNVYFSHSNMDADLSDGLHWGGAGYGRAGKRYARAISYVKGFATGPTPWSIASVSIVSSIQTDVNLTHSLGTDFTPTSGITGFEVNSGGNWIAATGARQSATAIRLTHASATPSREVRYQYAETPDVTSPVVDNTALAIPLTLTRQSLAVDAHPIPVYVGQVALADTGNHTNWSGTIATETAFTNRRITVILTSPITETVSSATIGGNTATIHHSSSSNTVSLTCMSAVVNTGTSLTIAVTFTGSVFVSQTALVWQVDDTKILASVPTDVQVARSTSSTTTSLNIANSAGGFCLSCAVSSNITANTGASVSTDIEFTKRFDTTSGGLQNVPFDSIGLGGSLSRSFQVTFPQSGTSALIVTAWAPAIAVNPNTARGRGLGRNK